jgi:LysR family transcriptional regulator, benzoate and cis,cis-muconate-responsive activator of ben and cat genes
MELRHLRYFVAVAEELNFRRAAERLHVTRPALSKQVKDLEAQTGVRLLERDTVSVSLTDAGSVFLAEARGILADVDRAVGLAREAQDGRRGQLRIGSVGQIASGFLPEVLKAFGTEFPGVEVTFVEMTPVEQLAALAKSEIHIGLLMAGVQTKCRGFRACCWSLRSSGSPCRSFIRWHPAVRPVWRKCARALS